MTKWEQGPSDNELLVYDDFYISYKPKVCQEPLSQLFSLIADIEYNGPETALYDRATNTWRILNGDYRREYEACGDSLQSCIAFYKANSHARSEWSTDLMPTWENTNEPHGQI